jgi:putative ubiquitin-RnfH superfamily antitoxin RatB of RatAB toxin-antitoxin module
MEPVNRRIQVEVAYAQSDKQCILKLDVDANSTIETIIDRSGIIEQFPEIDLSTQKIGVFSQLKKLTDTVQHGDRIEIYRSLLIDPKARRRAKSYLTAKRSCC